MKEKSLLKKSCLSLTVLAVLAMACTQVEESPLSDQQSLKSPDGSLELTFGLAPDGVPMYSLTKDGKTVVRPSRMGFELRGERRHVDQDFDSKTGWKYDAPVSLYDHMSLQGVSYATKDETWDPVWGEEAHIRNNYNELTVNLKQLDNGRPMSIVFRLFDDGLGFRYAFPSDWSFRHFTIKEERTEFAMAGDHHALWIPGDYDTQEYEYTDSRLTEISTYIAKRSMWNASQTVFSKNGVQTALQMKTDDGLYINIHEAAVVDFPTANLELNPATLTFRVELTPDAQGWRGAVMTPFQTPWRTVMVVDDARKILSSRLILNLNEPCKIEDTSWIHPTKYMGVWWEMITGKSAWSYTDDFPTIELGKTDYSAAKPHGRHGANNENVRRYIDFAAENGFDGLLIEGWNEGWEEWFGNQKEYVFDFVTPYPDFDIAALNRYAHSKGIRLIMHHETSSSVWNYDRHLEAAFDLMNEYGYDAVKTGYVGDIVPRGLHHYSQETINHYNHVIREAARHHIMVNAHEAVRPTGLCRTWPNMIGNESAMGTEFQKDIEPIHVTVLPFTRLQGGPMDYTPGILETDLSITAPGNTAHMWSTIAKQLALYVTMYSPLQMAADLPENYAKYSDAFQFIKDVAVDWERSEYLLAEPGDYIVIARQAKKSTLNIASEGTARLHDARKGYQNGATRFCAGDKDVWFIGGVTDENARELSFSLDFLAPGKTYEATIYEDAPDADYESNPKAYVIRKMQLTAADSLTMKLARSGGFAISLKEK